jgi:Pyridine nucleotide-disulphide oxidoreductase, dimerisation domain
VRPPRRPVADGRELAVHLTGDAVQCSTGSAPTDQVNPAATAAIREVDIIGYPTARSDWATSEAAEVIVTRRCGDACPVSPASGTRIGPSTTRPERRSRRTNLPDIYAAGDRVHTYHRLPDTHTYLPLGTTAHKQGRIADEEAAGGAATFAGSLGTQVVKMFDLVAARTGLRAPEATAYGWQPVSHTTVADDHKAYYPGAKPITISVTADARTGQMLGAQLIGHRDTAVAKRVDIYATAIHHAMTVEAIADLDLSHTPPLGSPGTPSRSPPTPGAPPTSPTPGP